MENGGWRCAYIAALVDNHAGIVITVGKDSNRKIGYRVAVECRLKVRSVESRDLITGFCDEQGIAYRVASLEETAYENYKIVIGRRQAVRAFLQVVHPYLVVRDDAVELLCQTIIPRMEQGAHREKESFMDLMHDIEAFREKAGRANRAKYDLQYFRDEWNLE